MPLENIKKLSCVIDSPLTSSEILDLLKSATESNIIVKGDPSFCNYNQKYLQIFEISKISSSQWNSLKKSRVFKHLKNQNIINCYI